MATDVLSALRRSRAPAPEPEPETPADTRLRVFHDGDRLYEEIAYGDWPAYRIRGYRQLAPHEKPDDLPQFTPRGRAIIPPQGALRSTTQTGQWAEKEEAAREHLDTFAARLAERIDRPPVPRAQLRRGERAPSPARAGDIAQAALTAEAACMLFDLVDSLQGQIRALQAAQDERR